MVPVGMHGYNISQHSHLCFNVVLHVFCQAPGFTDQNFGLCNKKGGIITGELIPTCEL